MFDMFDTVYFIIPAFQHFSFRAFQHFSLRAFQHARLRLDLHNRYPCARTLQAARYLTMPMAPRGCTNGTGRIIRHTESMGRPQVCL